MADFYKMFGTLGASSRDEIQNWLQEHILGSDEINPIY